jgi:predicted kinase
MNFSQAVATVEEGLPPSPLTTAHPVLVLLSGLPGSGKSYLARRLAEEMPFLIIESDRVRKILFPSPQYAAEESMLTHRTSHALIEKKLRAGVRVIHDATNLIGFHRELVRRIAERAKARVIIVRVVASEEAIRQRMEKRQESRTPHDLSDADWSVYQRMVPREEPIRRPHLVVDTGADLEEGIRKILREVRRGQ